jgi:hypothetical protein
MTALDPIIFRELPVIRQIILNETWLEAERRGYCVSPDDRVVRENVCQVVLRIGEQLRRTTQRAIASAPAMIPCPVEPAAA